MRVLEPLSPERLERAEKRLLHPAPGGKIEAAARVGVVMTLLVEQLRLTPAERGRKLEETVTALRKVRGLARKRG